MMYGKSFRNSGTPASCGNRTGGMANWLGASVSIVPTKPPMCEPVRPGGTPTSLYFYYDRNDLLLYVGITKRGISRNFEHNSTQEWWPFVARQEVEHHPTREGAAAAEKNLIKQMRPVFNKQHNPAHHELREAYLTLSESGGLPHRETAYQELKWLPLSFVSFDGNKFLYVTRGIYAPYVDRLDSDRYGFLCSLKAGKASVSREGGLLWVTVRGKAGRISAPRLRVAPCGNSNKRAYRIKGIDLIGEGVAHPEATKWSAANTPASLSRPKSAPVSLGDALPDVLAEMRRIQREREARL